ncbi:MAG: ketoacyl-ACP synthase III [Bacteroidales bacterium]|nr:ketoacyl-ACP synthase III [Bacteroidales bacterium]
MAFLSFNNIKIKGISAVVPKNVKVTATLPFFAPGEGERVAELTQVKQTRLVSEGVCASDLCQKAAEILLEDLKWDRSEIDALFFVGQARDYIAPQTASLLQDRLQLPEECIVVDLPMACQGYIYGLSVLGSMMAHGTIRKALMLVGETNSTFVSHYDKTTWPLHGDAGTATALEFDPAAAPMQFHFAGNGSTYKYVYIPAGGARMPITAKELEYVEPSPGQRYNMTNCIMEGMNVFSLAISKPPMSARKLAEHYGIDLSKIDYLLLHQANNLIDEKIVKKLKFDPSRVPMSLKNYGNTAACSIPLNIVSEIREAILGRRVDTLMCAIGSGFAWGSAHIELDNIACPPVYEYE